MRLKSLLLKPLSFGYGLVLKLRHWLYDRGFLATYSFEFPVIVIGNLSLGGSGKTPMTIYLADYFSEKILTVILSRGYGRKTKGFLEIQLDNQVDLYGDEPYLIKSKNEKTRNFVGENRVEAIQKIDNQITESKVIILDDAFQHRRLKGGFNILLTDYEKVFSEDELVPCGKLRDIKERSRDADLIIVTKSPDNIDDIEKKIIIDSLKQFSLSPIIFSSIQYENPINFFTKKETKIHKNVVLLTALANSTSVIQYMEKESKVIDHFKYKDHHQYDDVNVSDWISDCISYTVNQIVTTEKDAIKLIQFKDLFEENAIELIVIPIQMQFEVKDEMVLKKIIDKTIAL